MPSCGSTSRDTQRTNQPSASADSCCRGSRSRTNAPRSEPGARPNTRSARLWSRTKARVLPTIDIAGISQKRPPPERGEVMKAQMEFSPVCPLPITEYPQILLAHGGGGKLMHDLIETMFV